MSSRDVRTLPSAAAPLAAIVGFLVCVELASGVLQGFYTPIFTDIADRLPEQAIQRTLINPTAPMPSFSALAEQQPEKFKAMVAYLAQLKSEEE